MTGEYGLIRSRGGTVLLFMANVSQVGVRYLMIPLHRSLKQRKKSPLRIVLALETRTLFLPCNLFHKNSTRHPLEQQAALAASIAVGLWLAPSAE